MCINTHLGLIKYVAYHRFPALDARNLTFLIEFEVGSKSLNLNEIIRILYTSLILPIESIRPINPKLLVEVTSSEWPVASDLHQVFKRFAHIGRWLSTNM